MTIKTISHRFLLGFIVCLLGACEGKDEPFPSYIFLKPAACQADYDVYGSNSHKLNTAWLNVGNQSVGVYDMPHHTAIPVLDWGETNIVIFPGYWNNGIASTPIISPFHTNFVIDNITLNSLETDTIYPVFTYRSDISVLLNNDFEAFNDFEAKLSTVQPQLIIDGAFEGNRSLKVSLNTDNTVFRLGTKTNLKLPFTKAATAIELNYKNTAPLNVYIRGYNNNGTPTDPIFFLALREQTDWNKVYIDLSNLLPTFEETENYEIGFEGYLPSDTTVAEFYFDNIKVLNR